MTANGHHGRSAMTCSSTTTITSSTISSPSVAPPGLTPWLAPATSIMGRPAFPHHTPYLHHTAPGVEYASSNHPSGDMHNQGIRLNEHPAFVGQIRPGTPAGVHTMAQEALFRAQYVDLLARLYQQQRPMYRPVEPVANPSWRMPPRGPVAPAFSPSKKESDSPLSNFAVPHSPHRHHPYGGHHHPKTSPHQTAVTPSSGACNAHTISTPTPFYRQISPQPSSALSSDREDSAATHHTGAPVYFTKGSLIELENGTIKRVEDLRTEDFTASAELSPNLRIDSSQVVQIEDRQGQGTAILSFVVGENKLKVTVEAALEHPFFVFGQGWSSCSPERTHQRYGLTCHPLVVGDICISLTPRNSSTVNISPVPLTPRESPAMNYEPVSPTVVDIDTVDPEPDAGTVGADRWSATEQNADGDEESGSSNLQDLENNEHKDGQ